LFKNESSYGFAAHLYLSHLKAPVLTM
jgi:hypothetical protein